MVFKRHGDGLIERYALLGLPAERQQCQHHHAQEGKQFAYHRITFEEGSRADQFIKYRDYEQREQRRDDQSADYDGGQRALNLGARRGGDSHRDEAQRSDQTRQEYGTQQVGRAVRNDAAGREAVRRLVAQGVEMVDHQDAVQYRHAEQGDESHTGRDAERKSPQPQGQNAADERQRHGREDHQRIGHALEGEEEQQQDQHQCHGNHDEQRANGVLKVLELAAVLEIVARLEPNIPVDGLADARHDLLNIRVADIHADYHAALRSVTVDLQRAVHQIDRRHFAHRNLDALNRADEQPVEVQIGDFLLIETHHQIETALILEDRTGRLARIGRADDGVQLLDVDAVAGDLRAVVLHHQLRKSHGLLHKYVRCAGDLLDEFRGFFGLGIQFGHIFAVELDGDIGLGAGHQFVESQLNGLAEVEFRAGYRIERGLHLLDHLGARRSARPLLERFHHDHHVGILHGHRVGRNLRRADFSHDVPDFRKIVHQRLLRLLRELDAPRERTSGRKGHLHGEITLVERRDKLRPQPREKQETSDKRCERHPDGRPTEPQADFQAPLVNSIQPFEETVCQRAFGADAAFEEQRGHHRHISQRQDQRPDDAEHERLGHRCEIFALDARQRQNREENDQDDDDGKGRRTDYIACARNNLLVHLLRGERLAEERLAVYVGEDSLHDHDRTVDDDAEVNGPEAHQVGRDIK